MKHVDLIRDIFEWDVYNWKKALWIWEKYIPPSLKGYKVLEVGAGRGGLSLYFSLKDADAVYCTDVENPENKCLPLHRKYRCRNIIYEAMDVLQIPFVDFFDIVAFKSVMGDVSKNGEDFKKKIMIESIHRALKKNGMLFFAENLEASPIHSLFREKFIPWGKTWNYLKLSEVKELFSNFQSLNYITFGVVGCFGKKESQRKILGCVDDVLEKLLPQRFHYVIAGVAIK